MTVSELSLTECDKKFRQDPNKVPNHIKIKIRMSNPSQEPPAFSKTQNQNKKDMDVLCIFKMKIESQNLDHGCIKDQWPYPNQDQDVKLQSETSSVLHSLKWGLKGDRSSLHLQKQDKELQFRSWVYQRTVTISKSRLRCQTPVSNLQHPPKSQMKT